MLDIREAQADQFEEIWPIFREVVRAGETYPFPPETSLEEGRAYWFQPGARVYIGYRHGRPVASRYIVANKPGLGAHVCNTGMMVATGLRRQGIGREMLRFGIDKARELGFRAIQLNLVVATNAASLKLTQEMGFEIVGRLPEAFHWKGTRYVDAYIMYLRLD